MTPNTEMPGQPDDHVLAQFCVRLVEPLGGRFNEHWLVEAGGERFVLRRWGKAADSLELASINYEVSLVARIEALGWPVATTVAGPTELAGRIWSLCSFLEGAPPSTVDPVAEQRARGRLLAEFHASLTQISDFGQRPGWRRCEEILADPVLDEILTKNEQIHKEDVQILRRHLQRARERIAVLRPESRPGIIVHGDFTTWNLRFSNGLLSGILDFELAHFDHRVGDFALSWRGKYDDVIYGYNEISPLEPEEWELITPLWWAQLINDACRNMQNGFQADGWTIKKLLQRSALMGAGEVET